MHIRGDGDWGGGEELVLLYKSPLGRYPILDLIFKTILMLYVLKSSEKKKQTCLVRLGGLYWVNYTLSGCHSSYDMDVIVTRWKTFTLIRYISTKTVFIH